MIMSRSFIHIGIITVSPYSQTKDNIYTLVQFLHGLNLFLKLSINKIKHYENYKSRSIGNP